MRKITLALLSLALLMSCSTYSITTQTDNSAALKKMKNAALVVRISKNAKFTRDEHLKNISGWLAGSTQTRPLSLVSECDDSLCSFASDEDRLYQISDGGDFLKYKSAGILNLYIRRNEAGLKKILDDTNCDGIFIYEVYSILSTEMLFIEFDSVLCALDKNLSVVYLDNQSNSFESAEMNGQKMKIHLLDKISGRLMETLDDLRFVKQ